jgi:hypothetical protein
MDKNNHELYTHEKPEDSTGYLLWQVSHIRSFS